MKIQVTVDDEQTEVLEKVKGLGMKMAEKVKNLMMMGLKDLGYLNKK